MELKLEGLFVVAFLAIILYMVVDHLKLCNNKTKTKEPFNTVKGIQASLTSINDNVNKLKDLRDEVKSTSESQDFKKNYNYEIIKKLEEKLQTTKAEKETESEIKFEQTINNQLSGYEGELENLKTQLDNISHFEMANGDIKTIKSLENGLRLSIQNIKNKLNTHLIGVNNKCVSVDSVGNYFLKNCDTSDTTQHFISKIISNPSAYLVNLEKGINHNKDNIVNSGYPFTIMKSYNNQSCLQNNSSNVSVQPCTAKTSQKWMGLKDFNKCGPDTTTKC
jgi:hypothetical protein